jgi:predicted RNA-binding Zn ribbon-like protein
MDAIPLTGEPLALDLVNTRVHVPGEGALDLLATQAAFRRWLTAEKGRLRVPRGEVDLDALHALREQIAQAVEHARLGAAPPAGSLRALNDAQRAAPAHRELRWVGTRVAATPRRIGELTTDVLAELAEAAADLLGGASIRKVRRCEGPECQLLFLPAHPGRRWCSPALCGNRVRVARYYQRHKH